ncbi:hypothetical protein IU427_33825 [Nocardia beijingensis]|nr:hypothetical protein [Nocardia beijingensis]
MAVTLTGGNRKDVTELIALLDAAPVIGGRVGRAWRGSRWLYADHGHDHDKYRRLPALAASHPSSPAAATPTAPVWVSSAGR